MTNSLQHYPHPRSLGAHSLAFALGSQTIGADGDQLPTYEEFIAMQLARESAVRHMPAWRVRHEWNGGDYFPDNDDGLAFVMDHMFNADTPCFGESDILFVKPSRATRCFTKKRRRVEPDGHLETVLVPVAGDFRLRSKNKPAWRSESSFRKHGSKPGGHSGLRRRREKLNADELHRQQLKEFGRLRRYGLRMALNEYLGVERSPPNGVPPRLPEWLTAFGHRPKPQVEETPAVTSNGAAVSPVRMLWDGPKFTGGTVDRQGRIRAWRSW